jgi:uncharacterized protein (TIGR03435 family)
MTNQAGRRTALGTLLIVAGLGLSARLCAQTANDFQPSFNQATLKLAHPTPPYAAVLGNISQGAVTFTNVTLAQCLKFALDFGGDGQITGPKWIKSPSALFDITAKTIPGMPDGRIRLMTLTLLTQRFSLKLRHERRELPYYALVIDRKGSKLRPPVGNDATAVSRNGQIAAHRGSIPYLVYELQSYANAPVVDETRLMGLYDIRLQWPASGPGTPTAPSVLSDALTEQLGLKLEARKGPMDSVVVEHAERTPALN